MCDNPLGRDTSVIAQSTDPPSSGNHDDGVDVARRDFLRGATMGVAGLAVVGPVGGSLGHQGRTAAPHVSGTLAQRQARSPWPTLPRGWWRSKHEVIHPAAAGAVTFKEVDLDVRIVQHELAPGYSFHALAFNGLVPGPELRFKEGEWVNVMFTNRTDLLHTIHWHGVDLQYENDGVPYATQNPVMPGMTFQYRFQAIPAGTRFYHCHFGTLLHMQHAMHGALIIEPDPDPVQREFGYTRDYTLVLSSFDTNFAREEMNFMLRRMKERKWLMKHKALDARTLAVFKDKQEMFRAIESGWDPPYLPNRNQSRQAAQIDYNFFAINGKSYPLTEPLYIKRDETIRVRLINGGGLTHHMHLHGHQFWQVARDGNLLLSPLKLNTISVAPGTSADIIVEGHNPGYWTFHDHDTSRVTNNGMYPGGMLTLLVYEEMAEYDGYRPRVALDE